LITTGVCDRELFDAVLAAEKQRCERSKRNFVLLQMKRVSASDLSQSHGLMAKLKASIRETDVIGFHDGGIGVICTEVRGPVQLACEAVIGRLNLALDPKIQAQLRDSWTVKLYPDVLQAQAADPLELQWTHSRRTHEAAPARVSSDASRGGLKGIAVAAGRMFSILF
jgi:hypothetical protein